MSLSDDEIQRLFRQMREAMESPGMKAFTEHLAEQQKRMREAMESPGMKAFTEHFAEQQKQIREAMESPGMKAFAQRLAEQQKQIRDALESPGMKAFSQQLAAQQERIRETMATLATATARAVEAYRIWDEAERRMLDLLAPRGWLISPDTSFSEVHQLLRLADEEGVDAAEEALIAALSPARCRKIIESLYEQPSFGVWRPNLEQALDAHERGMFALSVPVWLIALEGILLAELGIRDVFTRIQRKKGATVRAALPSGAGGRLADALIAVIRTVASHIPRGAAPEEGELRRHAIFHGVDPHYGTEKASIQGVLLLEALHFQLELAVPTNGDQPHH